MFLGAAVAYAAGFGTSAWLVHDGHPWFAIAIVAITGSIRFRQYQ